MFCSMRIYSGWLVHLRCMCVLTARRFLAEPLQQTLFFSLSSLSWTTLYLLVSIALQTNLLSALLVSAFSSVSYCAFSSVSYCAFIFFIKQYPNIHNAYALILLADYIRTFTWDKKLETIIKGSVLAGGAGKLPTVVSPEVYRTRFCHAMDRYFLLTPDRWTGLGLGIDP